MLVISSGGASFCGIRVPAAWVGRLLSGLGEARTTDRGTNSDGHPSPASSRPSCLYSHFTRNWSVRHSTNAARIVTLRCCGSNMTL